MFLKQFERYWSHERASIAREILISILISSVISTAFSFYAGKLIDQRVAQRQFIYDYDRTFFDNPKYREVSKAIEEQYLYDRGTLLIANGGRFDDYVIDDYLNLLSDIWTMSRAGMVSYGLFDAQFAYYLCITYQNKEIQGYRARLRSLGFSDDNSYNFLDEISPTLGGEQQNCKTL